MASPFKRSDMHNKHDFYKRGKVKLTMHSSLSFESTHT